MADGHLLQITEIDIEDIAAIFTALGTMYLAFCAGIGLNAWKNEKDYNNKLESIHEIQNSYFQLKNSAIVLEEAHYKMVWGLFYQNNKPLLSIEKLETINKLARDHKPGQRDKIINDMNVLGMRMKMTSIRHEDNYSELLSALNEYRHFISAMTSILIFCDGYKAISLIDDDGKMAINIFKKLSRFTPEYLLAMNKVIEECFAEAFDSLKK